MKSFNTYSVAFKVISKTEKRNLQKVFWLRVSNIYPVPYPDGILCRLNGMGAQTNVSKPMSPNNENLFDYVVYSSKLNNLKNAPKLPSQENTNAGHRKRYAQITPGYATVVTGQNSC